MTTAAWSTLYPYVLPEVKEAPLPHVDAMIRAASIEFCADSNLWQVDNTPDTVTSGVSLYTPPVPTGTDLSKVMKVWLMNSELKPKATDDLSMIYPNWQIATGTPIYFTQRDSNSIILVPQPTATYTNQLYLTVALKPLRSSTGVIDWVFERWAEEIAAGAKARLMAQQGTTWANPNMAAAYFAQFEQGKRDAQNETEKSFGRARRRTRGHYF